MVSAWLHAHWGRGKTLCWFNGLSQLRPNIHLGWYPNSGSGWLGKGMWTNVQCSFSWKHMPLAQVCGSGTSWGRGGIFAFNRFLPPLPPQADFLTRLQHPRARPSENAACYWSPSCFCWTACDTTCAAFSIPGGRPFPLSFANRLTPHLCKWVPPSAQLKLEVLFWLDHEHKPDLVTHPMPNICLWYM